MMTRIVFTLMAFLGLSLNPATYAGGHDQLGVQTHYGHQGWEPLSTLAPIKDLGVGWIRDDLFWSSVETEKGKYEIPAYAWEWLKAAKAHDLKVIVILNGQNKLYDDPFDTQGYINFARFVAGELKGYADALELINEPFNSFRRAQPGYTPQNSHWNGFNADTGEQDAWVAKYLNTINGMADAIHAVAPDQYKILGLGCSPPVNARLLKLGINPHIDGQVLHPYSHRSVPELQAYGDTEGYLKRDGITLGDMQGTFISINKELQQIAAKYNGPQELWLTEQGYTTYWQSKTPPSRYAGYTESAQAKYAQRRLMECLGSGIRFASWYNFYEKGDRPDNSEDHFGIMRRDGSLKPAYAAIQCVAKTMLNWHAESWGDVKVYLTSDRPDVWPVVWDGSVMASNGESRVYTFANQTQRAAALWSTERADGDLQPRTADVIITSDRVTTKITAMDMMTGKTTDIPFEQTGRQIKIQHLPLLDHPVFLVLDGAQPAMAIDNDMPNLFAANQTWKLYQSKDVDATWELTQSEGNHTGTLGYQFPAEGNGFTGARVERPIAEQSPIITLQVKATAQAVMLVRVYDNTGQTHQYKCSVIASDQWQNLRVNLADKPQVSFGGANDKQMHYPMTGLFLGVETSAGPKQGTLIFRDLQVQTP